MSPAGSRAPSRRRPTSWATRPRPSSTPTGLAGAAVEALWLGTHLAIYPLGLVGARARDVSHGYRIEHLAPVQRGLVISDIEAAGTPILLLHGMADNRSVFTLLRLGLRRRGFGQVTTLNYSILTGDIRVAAAQLAEEVEALVAETGYERVHVVGHSMGGAHRAVLRDAPRRGRAGPHPGDPGQPAPRDLHRIRSGPAGSCSSCARGAR